MNSDSNESDTVVIALPDQTDSEWLTTSTVIDHRLPLEESDPADEVFASMSELDESDDQVFETFAVSQPAEKQHLLTLADLLAGNLDDIFEDLG